MELDRYERHILTCSIENELLLKLPNRLSDDVLTANDIQNILLGIREKLLSFYVLNELDDFEWALINKCVQDENNNYFGHKEIATVAKNILKKYDKWLNV